MSLRNRARTRQGKEKRNIQLEDNKFNINTANEVIYHCVDLYKAKKKLKLEPYRFFLKRDFDTASWSYRPPHYLIFGFDIFKEYKLDDEEQKIDFFQSFVLHEIAHSIYTDYRISKVVMELEERDLPFSVFNLFEDARIEFLLTQALDVKLNWSLYMELNTPYEPLHLFFWIVQTEGDKERFERLVKKLDIDLEAISSIVWSYYLRCIVAKNTFEIIDIVDDWMNEFNDEDLSGLGNLFYGEIEALNTPDSIIEYIKDAHEVKTISMQELNQNQNDKKMSQGIETLENIHSITNMTSNNLLAHSPVRASFDKKIINFVTKEIQKLFVENRRLIKTSVPSKRLHIRNVLLKNPALYKKRKSLRDTKKKITVVLDISGSMVDVLGEMLVLVEVLNILVKKDLMEGYLILTMSKYENMAQYQTFKFPLKPNIINHIITYPYPEGIAYVMKELVHLLRPSDAVLVFTDGIFADDPLDKAFFYRNNIDLYGVYLKNSELDSGYNLGQYFDNEIVGDDIFELTTKLVQMIKQRVR